MYLNFFEKETFKSEQTIWVNHIYDETVFWPNKAMMWCNVHGFDQGPGQTYWIGLDFRSFGIRSADYLIKCKNRATYNKYIDIASRNIENILSIMKTDPNLYMATGDDVDIEFIFRWGGEEKSFDIHLGWDWYAEER